jgi:hypothetical protein
MKNIEKMYTTPIRSLDKHNILSLQTSLTKMLCAKVLTELNLIFIVYLYSQCLLIYYYVYQTNSTNQTWDLDETQRQQRIRSITFLTTPTRHPAIPSFLPPPNTCTHNTKETFRNHCKRNYGSAVEEVFPCLGPGGGNGYDEIIIPHICMLYTSASLVVRQKCLHPKKIDGSICVQKERKHAIVRYTDLKQQVI